MAGYASEVKLFGKWSFEDVEVTFATAVGTAHGALRQRTSVQTLARAAGVPARRLRLPRRAAPRRSSAATPGTRDADAPRRPACFAPQINDISLEDHIAVKPKYAVYGAFPPRAPTQSRPRRRAAVFIAAGGAVAALGDAAESEP